MTLRRLVIGAVATLVVVLGVMPAAQAHDYLVGSTPKLNSTVTKAPQRVSLEFNDIVLTRPAPPQVSVKGPDGRYYETGCGKVTDRTVTVPVGLGGAGKYTVTWRIVSADGHPVSDSISFTYRPKAGKTAAKGIASPRTCSDRTAAAKPAGESKSDDGVPTAAIVAVVIIAVVGLGGGTFIVLTRGRHGRPEETDDDDTEDDADQD